MLKQLAMTTLALSLCYASASAGTLSFDGNTDKSPIEYKPGEKMVFMVQLMEDSKPVEGKKLKWLRRGDDGKTENGEAVSSAANPLTIETSMGKPGFVNIAVTACDDNGKPLKDEKNQEIKFDGGAGAGLEKLESYPEPKDFDAFWAGQKAKLAQVPLKANMTEVPSKDPKFLVYDVKVDCAGKKPVVGYFTKPKDAGAKSLKAKVTYEGYGVFSAKPEMQEGMMIFKINAHGIENGMEPEYYKKLLDGELKSYAFNNEENANPETAYFNGMMLRAMRALEFVKSQPEWDGKNLISYGGSQGGFQSLSAAGLDGDVTSCTAFVPWCCDLGGINLGRVRGWRPDFTDALAYYDPVNHAKRIKCDTSVTAGLGDYICPPSGITVLYNNIKAPKRVEYFQGKTHGYTPPNAKSFKMSSK